MLQRFITLFKFSVSVFIAKLQNENVCLFMIYIELPVIFSAKKMFNF